MSIMPTPASDGGMPRFARTFIFWVFMLLIAVVFWKLASNGPHDKHVRTLSYSDFLEQVDKSNVRAVKYYLSQNTAEIVGELRQPPEQFSVTVPKESISTLTDQLRKQGARVEVSQSSSSDWTTFMVNFAPLILLVAFWIFMMKQYRSKRDEKT